MLYLNCTFKKLVASTVINLTLTSVVFECRLRAWSPKPTPHLTLTSVVFELVGWGDSTVYGI